MIVSNSHELTGAVLAAMEQTEDLRLREIMTSLIRHLHGFVREVRLTEEEFRAATQLMARLGQLTNDSHNEVVLMAGSLLRYPTQGPEFTFTTHVRDRRGQPVIGAEVDVWHSSTAGLYENQDPTQADMNLRGKFTTDATGTFSFRSIKPVGYPIPVDGNVVGELLNAQHRHNYRPAHVHALIFKQGFKTLISQVFMPDDRHLESDVQFGVTQALMGTLENLLR